MRPKCAKLCACFHSIPIVLLIVIISLAGPVLTGCEASGFFQDLSSEYMPATGGTESDDDFQGQVDETTAVAQMDETTAVADSQEGNGKIYVHVCGCVNHPGLYELSSGDRVARAIEAAGGFSKKADQDAWNLAALLEDGMQIYVPARGESTGTGNTGSMPGNGSGTSRESLSQGDGSGKVNINTAGAEELMTLNGIGESRAMDIITYREENGTFTKIEDLKNVSGIGDGIFEKIKDKITVS